MFDASFKIFAGKFRRYHGQSFLHRLLDIRTLLLNIRDAVYFVLGTVQAIFLVKKQKPDVVFLKGGFVGVPVGLACALLHVPFMTHDSDALPGLANRITGKWAKIHAVALPKETYQYPTEKTEQVGVIVAQEYRPLAKQEIMNYRGEIGVPTDADVLLITGGSLGAKRLNTTVQQIASGLLEKHANLYIIHQVGKGNVGLYPEKLLAERLRELEFMNPMYAYMGAADIIVTRAGANTLAEQGAMQKAVIVVPNAELTSGHQLHNAQILADKNAAIVLDEAALVQQPELLQESVEKFLSDRSLREEYGRNFSALTMTGAGGRIAELLIGLAGDNSENQEVSTPQV